MNRIERKIYNRVKSILTKKLDKLDDNCFIKQDLCKWAQAFLWKMQGQIELEDYDYHSATTSFMLSELKTEYKDLSKINCLSVGGRVSDLVKFVPLFNYDINNGGGGVTHCTMIPIYEKQEITDITQRNLTEIVGDFFNLTTNEKFQKINVVLSHATIHCMNDTRYHNANDNNERPYEFAKKLNELCPNVKNAIVSVPVSINGCTRDNGSYLANNKFIESFTKNGYTLTNTLYDKRCLGGNKKELAEYYKNFKRFTKELPVEFLETHTYVVGNFHFSK